MGFWTTLKSKLGLRGPQAATEAPASDAAPAVAPEPTVTLTVSDLKDRIAELATLEAGASTDNLRGKYRARREEIEEWLAELESA
jgi:hypothetical protein